MSNKAHDLMGDGYARGYPGDRLAMRVGNRTAHALSAACNNYPEAVILAKLVCTRYQDLGCPELRSYDEFIQETMKQASIVAKKVPQQREPVGDLPMPEGLDSMLSSIDLGF